MRHNLVKGWLIYLLFAAVSTEILSLFSLVNRSVLSVLYLSGMVYGLKKIRIGSNLKNTFTAVRSHWLPILGISTIVLPLLFIALYYPPNNWDSMTYHLPRVMHWIQNHNVTFYPVNNNRQLYMGPLTEYVILHWQLLSGSDYFANLVQYFSMLFSVLAVTLAVKEMKAGSQAQFLSAILALTLPMGIMQSTTTQSDYVTSFLLIAFIYFTLRKSIWLASVAAALGILAKSTFPVFALPFGLLYFPKRFRFLLLVTAVSLALNYPQWSRNYRAFGSISGPKENSSVYLNQSIQPKYIYSNLVRNFCLNLGLPVPGFNRLIDQLVALNHRIVHLRTDDPVNSFLGKNYRTYSLISEDTAGNFIPLLLVLMAGVLLSKNKQGIFTKYYLALVGGWFFFSVVFKWQPWGTRLQLPLFVAACPVIGAVLARYLNKKLLTIVTAILIVTSWPFVAGNMIWNWGGVLTLSGSHRQLGLTMFDKYPSRFERYFIGNYSLYQPYMNIRGILSAADIRNIGLDLAGDSWEYPLWVTLKGSHLEYIRNNPGFKYQAVIYDDLNTRDLFAPGQIESYYDYNVVKLLILKT